MSSVESITKNTVEVIELEELRALLEKKERKAYMGIEPSGLLHIGFLICAKKIAEMIDLGFDFTVLLADWHAYINDKLGGNMKSIKVCGEYIKDFFTALGIRPHFMYASDMVDDSSYWEKVIRIAKNVSLARIRRAMTIMGRREDEEVQDAAKYFYPAMQVADIFHLGVDVALGGMDQRRAHMLARDIAEKMGWKKVIAIHTPILSSLKGGTRMDFAQKMSKSDPSSCIFVHDEYEEIERKIGSAYCPKEVVEGNPVIEVWKYILFPYLGGNLVLERDRKFGGDVVFGDYNELEKDYMEGKVHPADLKKNTAMHLDKILSPIRKYYEEYPDNFEKVKEIISIKR